MAKIDVQRTDGGDNAESDRPYEFQVVVQEGRGETRHRVTLKKADYERLSGGAVEPETLVAESFRSRRARH